MTYYSQCLRGCWCPVPRTTLAETRLPPSAGTEAPSTEGYRAGRKPRHANSHISPLNIILFYNGPCSTAPFAISRYSDSSMPLGRPLCRTSMAWNVFGTQLVQYCRSVCHLHWWTRGPIDSCTTVAGGLGEFWDSNFPALPTEYRRHLMCTCTVSVFWLKTIIYFFFVRAPPDDSLISNRRESRSK